MSTDPLDSLLRDAARDYNAPPEPPREMMWARIQAARARARWRRRLGLAAILVIGFAIGRFGHSTDSEVPGDGPALAEASAEGQLDGDGETPLAFRFAAMLHFSQTEALLTTYRSGNGGSGPTTAELAEWASDLLTDTRLLLDSPVAADPELGSLLEDLELILAQLAQLAAVEDPGEETEWVDDALERRQTLDRLRAFVPAGPIVGS